MDLTRLIKHPELMDKETLYDLRGLIALYPYHQTARLLMLQNLYLLHDPSFDEELRRAAVYITDRTALFNLVERPHYQIRTEQNRNKKYDEPKEDNKDRTISLIDNFLDSIPGEEKLHDKSKQAKRRPTPADAAIDYVSYMIQSESEEQTLGKEATPMKGQSLIDDFINKDGGKIQLQEEPEYLPQIEEAKDKDGVSLDEGYFTETLAKIYVKQGRYSKAIEIIKRLNLNYPKKNAYFADQIRFLEKLKLNEEYNNKKNK
ncbi:MAG: tetratricopeptide repeat protein [Prevotella sp.]|jgi:hypothetical protein|nr:tetratricopeptide repeat protein [Prevotella sp.]